MSNSRMIERRIGSLPVVEGDRLVGILTEHDLLKALRPASARIPTRARMLTGRPPSQGVCSMVARDVMTRNAVTVSPHARVAEACDLSRRSIRGSEPSRIPRGPPRSPKRRRRLGGGRR
jgi:CBS domain-containing protein